MIFVDAETVDYVYKFDYADSIDYVDGSINAINRISVINGYLTNIIRFVSEYFPMTVIL